MTKTRRVLEYAWGRGYRVNGDGLVISPSGLVRKTKPKHTGHLTFTVKFEGKSFALYVHHLAGYQKFGAAIFADGIQIRHLDNSATNNRLVNLELGDQSQNMMDRPQRERLASAQHAAKARRALTDDEVRQVRASDEPGSVWAKRLNVAKSTISGIRTGKFYPGIYPAGVR